MPQTSNLTILLTDIKGFTEKTSHRSRADIFALLEKHRELVLPVLTSRGGRLVKTIGDAFLMAFDSPTDAVLAGVAVQDALRGYNEDKNAEDRIEVRIAINSGEVALAENDVFGDPVNICSRIEGVAEAGEVFFTEAVYLAMNKNEVPSSEIGLLQLKGIPEKIRVYKVRRENPVGQNAAAPPSMPMGSRSQEPKAVRVPPAAPAAVVATPGKRAGISRRAGALLIDLIICGVIVNFIWPKHSRPRRSHGQDAAKAAIGQVIKTASDDAAHGTIKMDDKGVRIDNDGISVKSPQGEQTIVVGARHDDEDDEDSRDGKRWAWSWPLTWYLYGLIFLKRLGSTPGGKIFRLRVERVDGAPMEKRDRNWRALVCVFSGYCLGLGYLWALWDKDGRGWHDLFAGTRVVEGT